MTLPVHLRPVADGDVPVFFEFQLDPEELRLVALPPRDRAAFDSHWARIRADERSVLCTVEVAGAVAGHVVAFPREGRTMVGYWIGREHWGGGVATAALSRFLEVVTTRPLFAEVAVLNAGSIRVLEKCGFAQVGPETVAADGVAIREYRLDRERGHDGAEVRE